MAIRTLILSDIRLFRDGLERILSEEPQIDVILTTPNSAEAFEAVLSFAPDIVLIDLSTHDGLTTVKEIRCSAPAAKIVALAVSETESDVVACAEAGVAGYVARESSLAELVESVKAVATGELRCSRRVAAALIRRVTSLASEVGDSKRIDCLTRQESRVLSLVCRGMTNKEIARELSIEVSTVKNHVHNMLEKLHVHTRGEAAALMSQSGSSSFMSDASRPATSRQQ